MSEQPYKSQKPESMEAPNEGWLIEEMVGEVESVRVFHRGDQQPESVRYRYTINGLHIHHSVEPDGEPTLLAGDVVRIRYIVEIDEHDMHRLITEAELLQRRQPDNVPTQADMRRMCLDAAGHAIRLVTSDAHRKGEKGGTSVRWQDVADEILAYCAVASYRKKGARDRWPDAAAMARALDLE